MATALKLRITQQNGITDTGDGVVLDLSTTFGAQVFQCVTNTAAGGTNIQLTRTAGGLTVAWISGRVPAGGFTLTSTDISAWQIESNMNANIGGRYRVYRYQPGNPPTITELGGGPFDDGVEMNTAAREDLWAGNVTDQAFSENDRILLRLFLTNVGTMAGGFTGTLAFNEASGGTGDSVFNIAETVTFKPEDQTVSGAGAIDTAEAFGTLGANFVIAGAGDIASGEAFGADQVNLALPAVGDIATAEAFGTLSANFTLSGAGAVASEEAFGAHTVSLAGGGLSIDGAGNIATAEAFGADQINLALPAVGDIAGGEAFGTLSANFTLSGAGAIATAEEFGAHTVSTGGGGQTVDAAGQGIASGEAFGTDQMNLTLPAVGGVASGEAFGAGQLNLTLTGVGAIVTAEEFGSNAITGGLQIAFGEPLRTRIGSTPAVDTHTRIGSSPAVDANERIGFEVGTVATKRIGDPAA